MYVPPSYAIDEDAAWRVVADAGAGVLVVAGGAGLRSVLTPVLVSPDRTTMRAHLARANPWWKGVSPGESVLATFVAASAYVSPAYYPSRLESPGVVPTWDYEMVEVTGRVWVHEERTWLAEQVAELTERFESGREPRWRLEEADPAYVERLLGAVVGLEIRVEAITGAAKLSQNRPAVDVAEVRRRLGEGSLAERNVAARIEPPT